MLARVALLFAAAALLLVGATVSASGSDVLILDPNNFDNFVGGDLPVFVEFFAPSAGQHAALARTAQLHCDLPLTPLTARCATCVDTGGAVTARRWLPSMRLPPPHSNRCPSRSPLSMLTRTATSDRSSE